MLALDRTMRHARRGFTLIELVVVVIVIALLAGVGLVGYSTVTANAKTDQAKTLLESVAASQQSWYRSRGSFVSLDAPSTDPSGAHTTTSTTSKNLLKRIAPGTADSRADYVNANTPSTGFGKISIGIAAKNNWQLLGLGTLSGTGDCVGQIVAPAGSGLLASPPDVEQALTDRVGTTAGPGAPLTCAATNIFTQHNDTGTTSTAKPDKPANLKLTPAPGRIVLTWDPTPGAGTNDPTSYLIQYADGTPVATIDASVTSFADGSVSPLDPTKSYSYKVIAHNAAGDSDALTAGPAKPLDPAAAAPERPTGLTATWESAGVHLAWDPAGASGTSAAIGYEIRRDGVTIACLGAEVCASKGSTGQDFLSTEYIDMYSSGALQLGTNYLYELRALNQVANGQSTWTALTFTTPPPAPTGVTATALSGLGSAQCAAPACVTVAWTAPAKAAGPSPATVTGYRIYRGTISTFTPGAAGSTLVGSVDANADKSFTDRTLPGAATYYYKVVALNRNVAASTNASAAAAVSTVATAPTVSTSSDPASPGAISLSWTPSTAKQTITGYNVYRLDENKAPVLIKTVTGTSYTDTGADLPGKRLDGFTAYSYRVAAVTSAGVGVPSPVTTGMSPNAPPSGIETNATASTVTLHWNRVPGATYIVKRGSLSWTTNLGWLTEKGLAAGTAYTYTVTTRATDPATGLSSDAASNAVTAVTAPSAPSNLAAAPSGTNVTLTWTAPNPSTRITGYRIYRCSGTTCDTSNPVPNPSLETGAAGTPGWYGARAITSTDTSRASDGAASIHYVSNVDMPSPTAAYLLAYGVGPAGVNSTKYPVTAGQSLTATMDVRGDEASPSDGGAFPVSLAWAFYRADGSGIGTTFGPVVTLDPARWQPFTVTAVAPAGAVAAYPIIYGRRSAGFVSGDGWYADNARVLGPDVTTVDIAAPATAWTDTGRASASTYTYALSALTTGGEGAATDTVTTSTIPTAVTATIAGSTTAQSLSLSWTSSPVATSYDIIRNGAWLTSVPAGVTTFTDGSLVGGITYSYVIRAKNTAGSADSAPVSSSVTPDPPTGLTASPGATSIALSWLSVGADGYQLLRCTGTGCDAAKTGTVVATLTSGATTSYTNTALAAQTWYGYAVKAGRATTVGGTTTWTWSAASVPVNAKTVLDPPTNLATGAVTSTSVALTWTASPGASSYRVYRDGTALGAAPTTGSFTDTGLVPGMRYTYTVTAAASNGEESGQSGSVTTTTVLPAPTGVAVTSSSTSGVTISWAAVTGATSYEVRGCTVPCGTPTSWGVTADGTTLTLTKAALTSNTAYDVHVIARSTYATSAESTHVTAWTLPDAPAAPTVGTVTASSVALTWPAVPNAASYKVVRDGAVIATVTAPSTSYTDATGLGAGTSHTYALIVTNPGGDSAAGPTVTVLLLPAAPVATVTASWRQAVLAWPQVTSATSYEIWRCAGSGCTPSTGLLLGTIAEPTRSYTDKSLTDSTTYVYSVRAINATGAGAYSSGQSALTTPPVVSAPAFSNVTASAVTLSWAAVGNSAVNPSFETNTASWATSGSTVTRDTTVASDGVASGRYVATVTSATSTSMYGYPYGGMQSSGAWTPVVPGQTITASIDVRGDASSPTLSGKLTGSLEIVYYTHAGAWLASTAPTLTVLDPGSWKTVTATGTAPAGAWRAIPVFYNRTPGGVAAGDAWYLDNAVIKLPTDASTYKVFRDGGATPVYTGPATTFTDSGLSGGTSYSYTVASGNATGYSPVSPAATVTTVPDPVTALTVSATTDTSATVTWTAPKGASSYRITLNGTAVATVATTSYTFTGLTPATGYTFGVEAISSGGTGAMTTVTGTTRPSAPINVTATGQLGAVALTWSPVTGATGYKVLRNGGAPAAACATLAGTSCTDTGLANATAYTYTVIAVGVGGDSVASNPTSATTLSTAPTGLAATATGTTATVTWTAPSGAITGYKVYRCAGSSCTTVLVTTVSTPSYTDSALASGNVYTYQVTALTTSGESVKSSAVTVATIPNAPTGVTATGGNAKVTLAWTATANATGYAIYRCVGVCTPSTLLTSTATAGYTDTTAAAGTTYSYLIKATNAAGSSAASVTVSALTVAGTPTAGSTSSTPTSVTVNWAAPAGTVTGYKVYRGGTLVTTIANPATTTYTDTTVTAGTTYTFTVSAYNATGEGNQSAVMTVTATFDAPTGLAVTGATSTSVTLTWNAVTGATGYRVYRDGVLVTTVTPTTATITSLSPGTSYSFTVQAFSGTATSAQSGAVTGTTTLPTPTGLSATGGATQVALSWATVTGATGYYLYRCTGTCTPTSAQLLTTLTSGTAAAYTDTGLVAGETYNYAIAAYTTAVTSALSAPATAVTVPPAPTGLAFTSPDSTSITYTWAPTKGATTYTVTSWGITLYSGPATSATVTGLTPGTAYTSAVVASNSAGTSPQSAQVNALTRPAAATVTATAGYRQVALSWTAPTSATSYTVYACTGATCTPATSKYTGTALTFTDTALADNTTYRYVVAATNASGATNSAVVTVTTRPGAPTGLTVTGATTTSATLSWAATPGAGGYQVTRGGQLIADLPAGTTSYTDEGPNLLANSGYEEAHTTSPGISGYYSAVIARDTAEAHSGTSSLRVPTDSTSSPQGYIHYPASTSDNLAPAGSTTTESLWFKAPAGTVVWVGGRAMNASGSVFAEDINKVVVTGTGQWQLVTVPAWTQAQAYTPGLQARVPSPVAGVTFWVDDADVANTALDNLFPPNVATGTDTLAATTGFTSDTAGVALSSAVRYDIGAVATKRSLRSSVPATTAVVTAAQAGPVVTTPGVSYAAALSARLADPYTADSTLENATAFASLEFQSATGTVISRIDGSRVPLDPSNYQTLTVAQQTAPAGAVRAVVRLRLDGVTSPTTSAIVVFTDGWTVTSDVNPNSAYTYTVAAEDAAGTPGPSSAPLAAGTLPLQVNEVRIAPSATSTAALWAPNPAGTSYAVHTCTAAYGATCTPNWATPTTSTTSRQYTFPVLPARSVVCAGISVTSTSNGAKSDPTGTLACGSTAPGAPTNVSFSAVTTTGWTTSWTAPTPATGLTYNVILTDSAGTFSSACTNVTTTSCVVTGRGIGATYTAQIIAYDNGVNSVASTGANVSTLPGTPTLSGTISGMTASLSWTSGGVDVTYNVYRDGALVLSGLTGTSTSTAAPAGGTQYTYTVKAVNGSGAVSAASNAVALTSMPAGVTTAPTVTELPDNTISAVCPTMVGASSYIVSRRIGTGSTVVMQTSSSRTYTDSGPFIGGTSYWYSCQGSNTSGTTAATSAASIKPSYVTSVLNGDSPSVYYRLNETPSFGTSYNPLGDVSGNGNDGTLTGDPAYGPALTRGSAGSRTFGTGSYASIPLTGVTTTTPVTAEGWVSFPSSVSASGFLFTIGGTNLYLASSGAFGFNTSNSNLFGLSAAATTPLLGKTHHVVAVFGPGAFSTSTHKLYIDGVAQSIGWVSNPATQAAPKIGTTWGLAHPSYPWMGGLDTVAFYNSELPAATVTAHYNALDQVAAVKASNPLSLMLLDGAPLVDAAGKAGPAGYVGSPTVANAAPSTLPGFLTLARDQIALPGLPVPTTAGTSTTVEFVANFPSTTDFGYPYVFSFGGPTGGIYGLQLARNGFGFSNGSGDLYGVPTTAVMKGTHRIAASFYDGAYTGNSKLWIDGVPQTLSQLAGTAGNGDVVPSMQVSGIGMDATARWNQAVADVAIFNGRLTDAQAAAHAAGSIADVLADNPLALYRLDDMNAKDLSGNGRTALYDPRAGAQFGTPGALVSDADAGLTWGAPGKINSGGTDHPGLSIPSTNLPAGATDRTFEMWVKPGNMRQYAVMAMQGVARSQYSEALWFGRSSDPGAVLAVSDGSLMHSQVPAGALWDGNWHMLHVVVTGGNTISVYVDGAKTGSVTWTATLNTQPGMVLNGLPGVGGTTYTGAPGPMDEFALYPSALSPAAILAHYNASK